MSYLTPVTTSVTIERRSLKMNSSSFRKASCHWASGLGETEQQMLGVARPQRGSPQASHPHFRPQLWSLGFSVSD